MILIFIGPPGSGKGTVAKRLGQEHGFLQVSTGEILREEIEKGTERSAQLKDLLDAGKLVPDDLIVNIVTDAIKGKERIILDGAIRTLGQAKAFSHLPISAVLLFEANEEEIVRRLSERRICEAAQHNYHLTFFPPKEEGICDVDGSLLIQRTDDKEEIIRERYRDYIKKTAPLLDFYKEKLYKINAIPPPEEVYQQVTETLKEVLAK